MTEYASATTVAGLAREVETLRRVVDPMRVRVEELARLVAQTAETRVPIRASVPSWFTDSSDALLGDLVSWVESVYLRYPDGAAQLPDCWRLHHDLIEELLWLMVTWRAAYEAEHAPPSLAADWHDRYRPGVVRRIGASAGRCSIEAHRS